MSLAPPSPLFHFNPTFILHNADLVNVSTKGHVQTELGWTSLDAMFKPSQLVSYQMPQNSTYIFTSSHSLY